MSLRQILRRSSVIEILGYLSYGKECRFTDMKNTLRLSSSTLTRRLLELQTEGLVEAVADFEHHQFKYRLTKQGREVAVVLGLEKFARGIIAIAD